MFEPCGKCNQGWLLNEETSYAYKCDCLIKYQKQATLDLYKSKAGILNHEIGTENLKLKNKDLLSKIRYYANNIDGKMNKNCHLYLCGKNNSSKTFSAKSILHDACEKSIDCKFVIMGDLIDMISDSFAEESKSKEIDKYLNCKLLVVDDAFDKKKITLFKSSYQIPFLDRFIRKRLETLQLNTIFTSNVSIDNIESNGFSQDIQNLIERTVKNRGGYLEFNDVFVESEYDVNIFSIWD